MTEITSSCASFSAEELEEIHHYLYDERRCVTLRWIVRVLGITRQVGAALLQNILCDKSKNSDRKYVFEIVRMCVAEVKETDGPYRMRRNVRLLKDTIDYSSVSSIKKLEDESLWRTIYSIALKSSPETGAPSIQAAHEYDSANIRDMVKDGRDAFDATLLSSAVKPACGSVLKSSHTSSSRKIQIANPKPNAIERKRNISTASSTKFMSGPSVKSTTAKSFFSNNKASSSQNTSEKVMKTKTNVKSKVKSEQTSKGAYVKRDIKQLTKKDENKRNSSQDDCVTDEMDGQKNSSTSQHNIARQKESKVEVKDKLTYGNADDFVGDEDEDEEDWKEDEKRKKRLGMERRDQIRARSTATSRSKKRAKTRAEVLEERMKSEDADSKMEEENSSKENEDSVPNGAMDAFAHKLKPKTSEVAQTTRTHRRKRLVKKTTVDESGYFHTETVTEWEDVPVETVVQTKKSKGSTENLTSKSTNNTKRTTKNMKQVGLMGFFSKKK